VARHGLAAIAAVATEAALTYPLDTLKTLLQVSANAGKSTGIQAAVNAGTRVDVSILASEIRSTFGVSGFYGGVGWQLLGRLSTLGARFGVYELSCAFITDGRTSHQVTISEAFLAGLFAGSVESFVGTPFDILKLRAQLTACSLPLEGATVSKSYSEAQWNRAHRCFIGLPHLNPNIVSSLRRDPWLQNGSGHPPLVRDVSGLKRVTDVEGLSTLWRGVRPGMFRDASYAAVFFGSWQFLYELLLELKAFKMEPKPSSLEEIPPLKPWQLTVTAGIAASGAAAVSHTLDTAKTRSQATIIPRHVAMERQFLKWVKPGSWLSRTVGILPFDEPLLWRGLRIRIAQHGLAATALVGGYQAALHYFMHSQ